MALSPCGMNSEYGRLRAVLAYVPGSEIGSHPRPAEVLHRAPIDASALQSEFAGLLARLSALGIEVLQVDGAPLGDDQRYLYNMMYCRDLVFMTPAGAILSRMGVSFRRGEVNYARRCLESAGVPILREVEAPGTFEGADALWVSPERVIIGVGARTNQAGFNQVKAELSLHGVDALALPFTEARTQHLLGTLQIVDRDLALLRAELVSPGTRAFLEGAGFAILDVQESLEVRERQAMNLVTVAPREVLMPAGCPETRALYLAAGLGVAGELPIPQLTRGAGGLACALGILARDTA